MVIRSYSKMSKKQQKIQIDTDHPSFLRLGGHPILDFVNTKVIHSTSTEDRLEIPDKARLFFEDIFQISCACTENQFTTMIKHRHMFREFFEAMIFNSKSKFSSINRINSFLSKLSFSPALTISNTEEVKSLWKSNKNDSIQASTLIFQFLNFFEEAELSRLKKCANPNCSHLFYDVSRNKTRNWCSMKSCGNIMKAREFYKRSKKELKE